MNFTKGDWFVNKLGDVVFCEQPDRDIVEIVDLTFPTKLSAPETKANAHLIAAAPNLYEACKLAALTIQAQFDALCEITTGIVDAPNLELPPLDIIQEALTKAEGK